MTHLASLGMLIGRIALSTIFILAGLGKFMDVEGTSAYMASKGMTMVPFFLYSAAILEILAGLALLFGFKTRWAALLLALFIIPTVLIFHDFWNVSGPAERAVELVNFLKDWAIFGGLLYVACLGAGRYSVDNCCCDKHCDVNHKA